ncbi:hypothetical protein T484DRAFT_1773431, partial [Baffinella frigidus]
VQEQAAAKEAKRAKVLFDEDKERELLELGWDNQAGNEGGSTHAMPARPPTGPAVGEDKAVTPVGQSVVARATPVPGEQISMTNYVLAEYVCDFGNVIKGQQVQKEFRVTNVGFSQISFELPKSLKTAIINAGFVMEPDKVARLPGAPDFEAVDFDIIFNSTRAGVVPGPIDLLVPLAVRSGPQVNIYLRANVVVPDILVSSDPNTLRFGSVFCGHCRTISIQLKNHKEIPASWSFGQAIITEGGAPKPNDEFTVIPARGALMPGETCNVEIVFHPKVARTYNVKIPLKVAQNPTRKVMRIAAQSENLTLRFSPSMLELEPLLPFVSETEARVTEETLRDVDAIYHDDKITYQDVALLPLRVPGSSLQAEVLRAFETVETARAAEGAAAAKEEAREARRAAAEEGGEEGAEQEGEEEGAEGGGKLLPVVGVADTETVNMLVYAHPNAGGPRLARALAAKFTVGVLDLEEMLQAYLLQAGIHPHMEEEPSEEEGGAATMKRVPNTFQLDPHVAVPGGVAGELLESLFPSEPLEEGAEAAPVPEPELGEDGLPIPVPPRTKEVEEGAWLSPELLMKLVVHTMRELKYVRGVAVAGLQVSGMKDEQGVARIVKRALAGKTLQVVHAEWTAPEEGEEGKEGEAAEAVESQEESQEEKGEMGEEHDRQEMEGDMSPSKSRPTTSQDQYEEDLVDPMSVEEELSSEEREAAVGRYEEAKGKVLSLLVPRKKEEGEEEAEETPADNEGGDGGAAEAEGLPTAGVLVGASRLGMQKIEEVVMDVVARLPPPGAAPGEPRSLPIPAVFDCEIVTRPFRRMERRKINNFYILTPEVMTTEEEEEADAAEAAAAEERGEAP